MKNRILALLLCLVMVISCFAACGSKEEAAPETEEKAETAQTEEKAEEKAEESEEATEATEEEAEEAPEAEAGEPVYGGTLKIALNRTVSAKSLDPLYIDSTTADQICQNFGDTLVHTSADGSEFLPNIATAWEISPDGKTYTFTIRNDVYFHPGEFQDGRLMTAEDVAYSVNRAKDYWCNYLYFLDYAEATDESTVVCHLLDANATFLYELTSSSVIMVPKEEVEGWGEEFGMHPVSTGPFMVAEHVPDQYTKLVKNENYWGVEPYLDGVDYFIITDAAQNLNALKTGEVDISLSVSGTGIAEVRAAENLTVMQTPENRVSYFGFNSRQEYLDNELVREALIMAVDSEQLCAANFTDGDGTHSVLPVPLTSWGYDEALEELVPAYDPEGAKAKLAEAGYPDGFTLTMNVGNSDEGRLRAATLLQQFWAQIGVTLEIKPMANAEVTASYVDGTVVTWGSGQGGSSDPATFIGYFLSTAKLNTNYNSYGYSNEETDAKIAEALVLTSQEERAAIYNELIKIGVEYDLGIYYATSNLSWGVNNRVKGLVQENKAVLRLCGTEGTGINVWLAE